MVLIITRKIERVAKTLLILSLISLYMGWIMPEPSRAVTISATVASTMVSCETPSSAAPLGAIDNTEVYATYTTTTMTSSGSIVFTLYGSATSDNPGLYKGNDIIESVTSTATATLVAGTEGYGVYATVSAGTDLDVERRYSPWGAVTSTAIIGGLATGSASAFTVASSASAVSSSNTVDIYYKAAVSFTTPGGAYADTVTYTCTSS